MRGRVLSKLTYANVMATIAVFIALGGASYAAFHLPKNSVKSKNIVNGQVKQADLSDKLTGSEGVKPAVLNDGSNDGSFSPRTICFWTNYGQGHNDAGYYRDRAGVVHLQGVVFAADGTGDSCGIDAPDRTITTLPAGYRPANDSGMPTVSNDLPGLINVGSNGAVAIERAFPTFDNATHWVLLDGISFRCAPSGQNGCP